VCVEWYRGSACSVGKHLPSSLDVWKIHTYTVRYTFISSLKRSAMKCVVHFSFFFRVEASSGITVTAARFSPVHLFIFFLSKVGRRCVVLCFWLLDEAFHRQVNDKFGAVQKIWLLIVGNSWASNWRNVNGLTPPFNHSFLWLNNRISTIQWIYSLDDLQGRQPRLLRSVILSLLPLASGGCWNKSRWFFSTSTLYSP
jgi:hypothetical protein